MPSRLLSSRRRSGRALFVALAVGALFAPGCHRNRTELADNATLFARAERLVERRKFYEAKQVLQDIGLVEPLTDDLDPKVKLLLADAEFFTGGTVAMVEAQNRYEQFVAFHATDPKAGYARYMVGRCLMEQAENPENDQDYSKRAVSHFETLIGDLPADSPWLRPSREALLAAQDRLADHEWLVACYYVDRGRWPGAIGRLSSMLERYPGTRRRGEALYELARAHQQVGDVAQARLTIDRLIAENPQGALGEKARQFRARLPAEPAGERTATSR